MKIKEGEKNLFVYYAGTLVKVILVMAMALTLADYIYISFGWDKFKVVLSSIMWIWIWNKYFFHNKKSRIDITQKNGEVSDKEH